MVTMEILELDKEDRGQSQLFKLKIVEDGLKDKETFQQRPKGKK